MSTVPASIKAARPPAQKKHEASPAITITGLSKRFGRTAPWVLDGIDVQIAAGEFVCLLGASGCGKSTVLNIIAGLESASVGRIDVSGGPAMMMFQDPALLPWLTARRNVELALRLGGVPRPQRKERASELLELVNLSHAADKRPHQLSGGMRQRVALARALAQERPVLLMDEPFAALDAITRDLLHVELERVWHETGRTIVFVTHNVREALRLGQRIMLLSSRPGRVAAEWTVPRPRGSAPDPLVLYRLENEITARLRSELRHNAH